jgi:hypothetical protein
LGSSPARGRAASFLFVARAGAAALTLLDG